MKSPFVKPGGIVQPRGVGVRKRHLLHGIYPRRRRAQAVPRRFLQTLKTTDSSQDTTWAWVCGGRAQPGARSTPTPSFARPIITWLLACFSWFCLQRPFHRPGTVGESEDVLLATTGNEVAGLCIGWKLHAHLAVWAGDEMDDSGCQPVFRLTEPEKRAGSVRALEAIAHLGAAWNRHIEVAIRAMNRLQERTSSRKSKQSRYETAIEATDHAITDHDHRCPPDTPGIREEFLDVPFVRCNVLLDEWHTVILQKLHRPVAGCSAGGVVHHDPLHAPHLSCTRKTFTVHSARLRPGPSRGWPQVSSGQA